VIQHLLAGQQRIAVAIPAPSASGRFSRNCDFQSPWNPPPLGGGG
jgi:hypothetical protein